MSLTAGANIPTNPHIPTKPSSCGIKRGMREVHGGWSRVRFWILSLRLYAVAVPHRTAPHRMVPYRTVSGQNAVGHFHERTNIAQRFENANTSNRRIKTVCGQTQKPLPPPPTPPPPPHPSLPTGTTDRNGGPFARGENGIGVDLPNVMRLCANIGCVKCDLKMN
ncbi:hypothetical protein M0802_006864 [Mischocyttarus mexicanus]|nr:hypothetical protein M0802_006864 [Mischocyttarus mexicanus]